MEWHLLNVQQKLHVLKMMLTGLVLAVVILVTLLRVGATRPTPVPEPGTILVIGSTPVLRYGEDGQAETIPPGERAAIMEEYLRRQEQKK